MSSGCTRSLLRRRVATRPLQRHPYCQELTQESPWSTNSGGAVALGSGRQSQASDGDPSRAQQVGKSLEVLVEMGAPLSRRVWHFHGYQRKRDNTGNIQRSVEMGAPPIRACVALPQ